MISFRVSLETYERWQRFVASRRSSRQQLGEDALTFYMDSWESEQWTEDGEGPESVSGQDHPF